MVKQSFLIRNFWFRSLMNGGIEEPAPDFMLNLLVNYENLRECNVKLLR